MLQTDSGGPDKVHSTTAASAINVLSQLRLFLPVPLSRVYETDDETVYSTIDTTVSSTTYNKLLIQLLIQQVFHQQVFNLQLGTS